MIIIFVFFCQFTHSQSTKLLRKQKDSFYQEYYVLKNDTSVKHGWYYRKYKNFIIEQGNYYKNQKTGKWSYFSLDGVFEFEYNYDLKKITKIAQYNKPEDYNKTPVFFDGSPIVPYLYLVSHVQYPSEAKNLNINGKVSLSLNIDSNGNITSLRLTKKLHHLLDKEVLNVAKKFPRDWNWIPATYNGQKVNSEYQIDIEFELVDSTSVEESK